MDAPVVGRDVELEQAEALLDGPPAGPAVLVLQGEPGIGKTAVWREVVRRAREHGLDVLSCRPAAAEARLSYGGLADLVRSVPAAVTELLPAPQRHALDVALLRVAPGTAPLDPRAVASALLSTLETMAARAPVLVAIDDLQWLDAPTRRVLEFAVRRLETDDVRILVSERGSEGAGSSVLLAPEVDDRVVRCLLGPLSLASLHVLLKTRLGRSFPRPTLVRIERASAGNPLHALEIGAELLRRGGEASSGRLPIPAEVERLLGDRIEALPAQTREALVTAAAMSRPTVPEIGSAALAPAEEAGLIRISGGSIEFVHPLFASVAYSSATTHDRVRVHLRLAALADELEEQARHLAVAAHGPDPAIAALLERAVDDAQRRGAPDAAAELAREAVRLTPPPEVDAIVRREILLANMSYHAGDAAGARQVMESAVLRESSPALRAEAIGQLGWFAGERGDWTTAIDCCHEALRDGADSRTKVEAHLKLATFSCAFDLGIAAQHARAVVTISDRVREPRLWARGVAAAAYLDALQGEVTDAGELDDAIAILETVAGDDAGSTYPGFLAMLHGDLDTARHRFEAYREQRLAARLESGAIHVLGPLAEIEYLAGRWQRAEELAEETLDHGDQTGQRWFDSGARCVLALLEAARGRFDRANRLAGEILAGTGDPPHLFVVARGHWAAGVSAFTAGDALAADGHFTDASEALRRLGMRDAGRFPFQADHVEALIARGEVDRAAALAGETHAREGSPPSPWTQVMAARSEALVQAARGELEAAESSLVGALALHEDLPVPFELGRTLLCLGKLQRRRNHRRLARDTLARAEELFDSLGAEHWADAARAERSRIGVRQSSGELTENERRVAELAAAGMTNAQIAAQLFISARTVEANLARAYRKLGIRSRAELGAMMASRVR